MLQALEMTVHERGGLQVCTDDVSKRRLAGHCPTNKARTLGYHVKSSMYSLALSMRSFHRSSTVESFRSLISSGKLSSFSA